MKLRIMVDDANPYRTRVFLGENDITEELCITQMNITITAMAIPEVRMTCLVNQIDVLAEYVDDSQGDQE